ncbi:MAG: 6-phosphogluconolactonase [Pseudomonadota bacterium]
MAQLKAFEARDDAANHVATLMTGALAQQLASNGSASLLLSGGSSPGPVFDRLSTTDIDWANVSVGLVDERWVPEEDPRSNAALVRKSLLQGKAASAAFTPMYTTASGTLAEAAPGVDAAYVPLCDGAPVVLLGMGPDGHTASWFPGASGLDAAMDPDGDVFVSAIDATGAAVAGDMPHRMTITARTLLGAGLIVLYITGQEKRSVLDARDANLPIHFAERLLGDRLMKVWAP